MLQCPACGSGWIVVGLPYRGTLSCVNCQNQWPRPAVTPQATEGQWYDRHLSTQGQLERPAHGKRPL